MSDTTWERWTWAELEDEPTLSQGQTDDLKLETQIDGTYVRVWLARTGVEDGEPYDNRISVETLQDGSWRVVHEYPGK